MQRSKKLMEMKSFELPAVVSHPDGFPLYFLTGKKYLYQTLFCIQSLVKVSETPFRFILVDDGSFDQTLITRIQKQLPQAEIVTNHTINQNLALRLPEKTFPHLHYRRSLYPHLKKLTDIHTLPGNDWKLVLDSDMLFWNTPHKLLTWLDNPKQPIHMIDCVESYGYSHPLMESLCGSPVPELLNVGIIGLQSSAINWAQIEYWVQQLEAQEGTTYYLEQALSAMLIGHRPGTILDAGTYRVNPNSFHPQHDVLHHYVDVSKKLYFREAWKKIID